MIRLKPTVISLTAAEVKDAEDRCRSRSRLLMNRDQHPSSTQVDEEMAKETVVQGSLPVNSPNKRCSREAAAGGSSSTLISRVALSSSPNQGNANQTSDDIQSATPVVENLSTEAAKGYLMSEYFGLFSSPVLGLLPLTPRELPKAQTSVNWEPDGERMPSPSRGEAGNEATDQAEQADDSRLSSERRQSPSLPPPFSQRVRSGSVGRPIENFNASDYFQPSISATLASGTGPIRPSATPDPPARRSSLLATTESGTARAQDLRQADLATTSTMTLLDSFFEADEATPADTEADPSSVSTPRPRRRHPRYTPRTPDGLRVYNDSLAPSSQPQTPQNLPEARHQSLLRGSYTAPAARGFPAPIRTPTTSRLRHRHRNASPPGLQTPGFRGLYGGIENTDEMALFEQAQQDSGQGPSSDVDAGSS